MTCTPPTSKKFRQRWRDRWTLSSRRTRYSFGLFALPLIALCVSGFMVYCGQPPFAIPDWWSFAIIFASAFGTSGVTGYLDDMSQSPQGLTPKRRVAIRVGVAGLFLALAALYHLQDCLQLPNVTLPWFMACLFVQIVFVVIFPAEVDRPSVQASADAPPPAVESEAPAEAEGSEAPAEESEAPAEESEAPAEESEAPAEAEGSEAPAEATPEPPRRLRHLHLAIGLAASMWALG